MIDITKRGFVTEVKDGDTFSHIKGILKVLKEFYKSEVGCFRGSIEDWKIVHSMQHTTIPVQSDGYNCGVYVCLHAYSLSMRETGKKFCGDLYTPEIVNNRVRYNFAYLCLKSASDFMPIDGGKQKHEDFMWT